MFNKSLTIVNKYNGVYKCTNINGFWSSSDGITLNGTNLIKSDGFTCRILQSEDGYVKPKLYNGNGWTLRNDDYIIKGEVSNVNSIAEMKENYECMKITNVANKDYGSLDMWHFEISGE